MAAGVDGVRLDAVPYLYEREGTSCENLPETHAFLEKLRKHVDPHWPGRMLLAEANQWPEDAIAYFGGDGDECHMNFHFPLMPRLFMSLRMEDRYPIIDILEQTPPIPPNAQWAMFLRNHDELTLEMVTDEERDYMWRVYASDPAGTHQPGHSPAAGAAAGQQPPQDRADERAALFHAGTPVIYYGDEIGMGDNIFLGDRNGVRTPMQWIGRSQRRVLPGQPAATVSAADHRSGISLRDDQRRSSACQSLVAAVVDAAADRTAKAASGFGQRGDRFLNAVKSEGAGVFIRRNEQRTYARRRQPVAILPARRARSLRSIAAMRRWKCSAMSDSRRFLDPGITRFQSVRTASIGSSWSRRRLRRCKRRRPLAFVPTENALGAGTVDFPRFGVLSPAIAAETAVVRFQERRSIRKCEHAHHSGCSAAHDPPTQSLFIVSVEFAEGEPEVYALPLRLRLRARTLPLPKRLALRVTDVAGRQWTSSTGWRDVEFARHLLRMVEGRELPARQRPRLSGRDEADAAARSGDLPARCRSGSRATVMLSLANN